MWVQDAYAQVSERLDKLHKPLVATSRVVAAGNRIVLQPEDQGGSYIEDVRSKRRKRIFERNGVYVLPCSVVKGNSQKRLAPLDESPKRPAGLPASPVTSAEESGPARADGYGPVRADGFTDGDMVHEAEKLRDVPAPVFAIRS